MFESGFFSNRADGKSRKTIAMLFSKLEAEAFPGRGLPGTFFRFFRFFALRGAAIDPFSHIIASRAARRPRDA